MFEKRYELPESVAKAIPPGPQIAVLACCASVRTMRVARSMTCSVPPMSSPMSYRTNASCFASGENATSPSSPVRSVVRAPVLASITTKRWLAMPFRSGPASFVESGDHEIGEMFLRITNSGLPPLAR